MEQELYKTRSAAACVRAAYQLFTDNFLKIMRHCWLPALAFAIALASAYIPPVRLIAPVLTLVAGVWFYASLYPFFNGQSKRRNLTKILKLVLLYAIISFVGGLFVGLTWGLFSRVPALAPHFLKAVAALGIVLLVLMLVFTPPFSYFMMKYIMEDISMHRSLWPSLKTGLRHWGFLFVVLFIASLILMLISIVVLMPMLTLNFAQAQSATGVLMGDPAGLPSGFLWLLAITTIATFFLVLIMDIWMMCVFYYAYGSVEQQERERKSL